MKTKILGLLAWPSFTAKLRGVKISPIGDFTARAKAKARRLVMEPKRAFAHVAALFIVALCPQAHAQAGISLAIEKHARLTEQGADVGFRRGSAGANVSLFVCTLVQNEQICFQGSTQRRVIIRGQLVP